MKWIYVVALVLIAFCATRATLDATSAHKRATDWSNRPEVYVTTYRGHPLTCLVVEDQSVVGNIGGLTCDWYACHRRYGP